MKKQILAVLLIAVLCLGLLAGCSNKNEPITQAQAQTIALKEAGLTADQVNDVHVHVVTQNGLPCYSVHITTADSDFSIVINAANGEVMK